MRNVNAAKLRREVFILTSEQEEEEHDDGGVSEVEEGRSGALDLELGDEVVDAVRGQVERGEAGGQEAAPPPVIILKGTIMSRFVSF